MFRYLCKDYEFKPKKVYLDSFNNLTASSYGCSTHPHNTYMQLLAETGVIGLLFLLSLLIYLLTKIILIGIFVNIWPIIPTGNFFNNWLSMLYFIPISFYLFEYYFKKRKKIV